MTRGSVKQKSETRRLLEVGHQVVPLKVAATLQINPSATKVLEPPPTSRVLQARLLNGTINNLLLRRAEDEELVAEAAQKAKAKAKTKARTKGRKETLNHHLVLPLLALATLADPLVARNAIFVVRS